jgi:C-terminal processing protease CtpA/Prc
MTGDVTGHVGRLRSLTLGGQVLRNVVATFPDSPHQSIGRLDTKNGNLGSGLLRRFNVTFDYAGERMLLEPSGAFRDPFEWDMSGLRIRESADRGVWVEAVLPGSPAEKAGIEADDVLTQVDGKPAGELCAFGIKELLKRDGEKLRLRVQRGSEELTFEIRLRRLV